MLSQLLKDHQAHMSKLKNNNIQLKREAKQTVRDATDVLAERMIQRVSEVLQNQKKIEAKEVAELSQHAIKLHKQTDQWLALVHQFNGALKVFLFYFLKERLDLPVCSFHK
ncbi:hypothetical protein DSO57_1021681 [Entomophthora muscae]|uniref:Uncharacterized protein n=1 Tax=Entomophthora muscae TaxID=34485 RepID=A0ACC2U1N9_9FUNG|nr:hypothetical protein DSO57_1021681 [Entomophthora muscae]